MRCPKKVEDDVFCIDSPKQHSHEKEEWHVQMKISQLIKKFETNPNASLNCLGWKIAGRSEFLTGKFRIPDIVRERSIVHQFYPKKSNTAEWTQQHDFLYRTGLDYIKNISKMLIFSQAGAQTGFHMDFSGSDVFYLMLSGVKTFYVCEGTPENIAHFRDFEKDNPDRVKENFFPILYSIPFAEITLVAGDLIFMPSQVIHFVHTISDGVVFAGNYLSRFSFPRIMDEWTFEKATEVTLDEIFPHFEFIMFWHLHHRLQQVAETGIPIPDHEMDVLYDLFEALMKYHDPTTAYNDDYLPELVSLFYVFDVLQSHSKFGHIVHINAFI